MKNCKNFNVAISIIIIGIVSVLGFQNYQKYSQDKHFEQIILDLNNLEFDPANEKICKNFISEIQNIYTTENLEIDKNIKYVWVLSARHSYTKIPINSDAQNIGAADKEDGYNRMRLGIEIAREVAAKKLDKQISTLTSEELKKYEPIILFNGGAYDNSLLKEALDKNIITDYPKENFYIFTLPEGQVNTGGQFKTLYKEHEHGNIDLSNAEIAIVTHAYHFPRVNRYFDNKPNFDFFFTHNTKPMIFLVDRKFEASGVDNELKQELIKLPSYIEKGFISRK
ncbi:hypothetical protein RFEPED_1428 [Rickettsia felis str. Pedreira]|uniref:DUF218 domain-containing protein n=2 Tax=Rickettsia felis TaxID=42862 RepID=A0A0F3MTC0_RICFI|nr:hypothetical protein [Rickettsia felis]AAY61854.1 unknown [Rickettsia felis URRWXCal2]KJV59033.1 hypothetical protein RFEPED_1428 [Rickettsia felis str. Pedreira]MDE8611267.1 hypothetical protein [Rickettsia felis]